MSEGTVGFLIFIVILGFSAMSKPTDDALRQQIFSEILSEAQSMKLQSDDDFFSGTMKFLCRLSPIDCAEQIVNHMIKIDTSDFLVLRVAELTIAESPETSMCYGFFNTWKCNFAQ